MEVSGVVFRPLPCFSGAVIDAQSHHSSSKSVFTRVSVDAGDRFSGGIRLRGLRESRVSAKPRRFCRFSGSGFCDDCHEQYYSRTSSAIWCGGGKKEKDTTAKKMKKKLKLLKGLSKDLSMFSEIGFGLDPDHGLADQVKGKMISEAAELLLGQLQQLKVEEKELKRKRKEEKANLKAARMQNMINCESSLDSSSESSDSECGEVVDMSSLKSKALVQPRQNELQHVIEEATSTLPNSPTTIELQPLTQQAILTLPSMLLQGGSMRAEMEFEVRDSQVSEQKYSTGNCSGFNNLDSVCCNDLNNLVMGASARKIEVCMGGKCKKSGAASLMEEFQRRVGSEGLVVGCKCMGKCRDGPNVRVLNTVNGVQAEGVDEYVRAPSNPLCIGVGLEDVSLIVSNFFGGNQQDLGLAAAS